MKSALTGGNALSNSDEKNPGCARYERSRIGAFEWRGLRAARALDLGLAGKLQMAVSEPILTEYDGVLRRARFGIKPRQVSQSIRLIRKAARIVSPGRELTATHDPADNRFLECAAASKADYLVTGNKRHFPTE